MNLIPGLITVQANTQLKTDFIISNRVKIIKKAINF